MPEIGQEASRKMLKIILEIFGGSALIIIVIIAAGYSIYVYSPQKQFLINFAGDVTFNDGNSTWIMDNRQDSYSKIIILHRVDSTMVTNAPFEVVSASEILDQTGKKLDSASIRFNGTPVLKAKFPVGKNVINVTLKDYALSLGSFDGRILVTGSTPESIPITISTKPLVLYAILLVITGALISVCIWEVLRYTKTRAKNKTVTALETRLQSLDSLAARGDLTVQAQRENVQSLKTAHETELGMEYLRNTSHRITIPRIIIVEFLAALLGIAIALFGVLYNENITGVKVFDAYQILTLIGIGLGAGSLKELVDKF